MNNSEIIIVSSPFEMMAWEFMQSHPTLIAVFYIIFGVLFITAFGFILMEFFKINREHTDMRRRARDIRSRRW